MLNLSQDAMTTKSANAVMPSTAAAAAKGGSSARISASRSAPSLMSANAPSRIFLAVPRAACLDSMAAIAEEQSDSCRITRVVVVGVEVEFPNRSTIRIIS